jgi:hypothetical protein
MKARTTSRKKAGTERTGSDTAEEERSEQACLLSRAARADLRDVSRRRWFRGER